MTASRSHVRVAMPSGTVDSEPGRAFIQERMAVFAVWNAVLSFGFLVLRVIAEFRLNPGFGPGILLSASYAFHAAGSAAAFSVWLVVRRARALSSGWLRSLDAGATVTIGACFAGMGAALASSEGTFVNQPHVAMLTATLAVAFTMMWRAVAVPSTAMRTAAVTTAAVAPLMTADVVTLAGEVPLSAAGAAAPLFAAAWGVMTIVTSTVASSVVFGLRREVQRVQRLGQYTLEEKIGEGAMGIVYRASHAMLRRPTAIKLLPPDRAGQVNLKRFEREVQLTAQLTHPNTVAIYDYGRTPDGVFYYAMELLEGLNLEDLVRRYGAQPDGRVIHILRQVCGALGEAHALGVIHRDIKPANVILTVRGGEPDVAKVVDFGLVTRLDTGGAASSETLDGAPVVAGTPLYFSPEAIAAPDQIDARSDLYALGVVGYLLLTGQRLFEGRTIMELCAHHLHTPPMPPSVRLGRAIDPTLEAALLRCLAKAPSDRPPGALALDETLRSAAAATDWTTDDARAWWRMHWQDTSRAAARTIDPEAATMTVDLTVR
jgi:eukaryotic-like serine/threonine-protein kinase